MYNCGVEQLRAPVELESYPRRTQVIIVGGSLSGLALHQELSRRGTDNLVFESAPVTKSPSIHYLTSQATARSLGLCSEYERAVSARVPITGYIRYDGTSPDLSPLESLDPDDQHRTRDGFVTFSLHELRQALGAGPNVLHGTPVIELHRQNGEWLVMSREGNQFTSKVIIDATGTRARVYHHLIGTKGLDALQGRAVRACFGGVYPFNGDENKLLFIDKFPTPPNLPRECAGWVMPLGGNKAEVVVGLETSLQNVSRWHTASLKYLIEAYIDWFNQRGIPIDFGKRQEVVSGTFSEGFVDYRKLPQIPGVALFGEALGLNHPLNGYLIRNIARYAQLMVDQIEQYLREGRWNPHEHLLQNSVTNFGLQHALSINKRLGAQEGLGRSRATRQIQSMLIEFIGKDGLWSAIDNGVNFKTIISGLLSKPKYADVILSIGLDYLKILLSHDIYFEELRLKIKKSMSRFPGDNMQHPTKPEKYQCV